MSDRPRIYFTRPGERARCSSCDAQRAVYLFSDQPATADAPPPAEDEFEDGGGTVRASWLCVACALARFGPAFREHLTNRALGLSREDEAWARQNGA